ncbi:MAG: hypothetical protein GY773_06660, partial [Actinomycetia bacterium]|nr:hypothetical protein [Actinomycetes bacterium]
MYVRPRRWLTLAATMALAVLAFVPAAAAAKPARHSRDARTVVDVDFLGEVVVATGT